MSSPKTPKTTIILGGGIIGLSTAYYLSLQQPNAEIHILDSAPSLLLSSSGFAGGFLAKDWFSPASASLGALSFRLHKELADAHDGGRKWGYSQSTAYSLSIDEYGISDKPARRIRLGIGPLAGYSLTVRSPRYTRPIAGGTCHTVFSGPGREWSFAPEAIARMTSSGRPEVYVAGLNDGNMPLPPDVTGVMGMYDRGKARELRRAAVLLTGLLGEADGVVVDDLEVVREGLCLRPVADGGKPIVARVEEGGSVGVFVAAGHGPWGISLSLGTGLVVAELVQGKETSADIRGLGVG